MGRDYHQEASADRLFRLQIAAGCFGTDGYGQHVKQSRFLGGLGGIVLKTTTLKPISPDRKPQFRRLGSGNYWNYVGLRNPGIEAIAALIADRGFDTLENLWLSLYASSTSEYLELISLAEKIATIKGYEINLSCPNYKDGSFQLPDPSLLAQITNRPLRYKISLAGQGKVWRQQSLQSFRSIVIGNALPYKGGGLSGLILKERHLKLIASLKANLPTLEIIAAGGVESVADIDNYLKAGATGVQIGAYFRATGELPV